jgi:hypothetical protein
MGIIRSVNGPTQIKNFASQAGENGMPGARYAVAQEISRLSPNAMKNLVKDHAESLNELFSSPKEMGPNGSHVLQSLAEEQERIQQATRLQVGKTGSNTFDKLMAGIKHLAAEGHQTSLAGAMGMALGFGAESLMHGDLAHAASVVGGAAFLGLVRAMRAHGLHDMRDLIEEGMANPAVGKAMIKQALDEKGNLREDSINALTDALKQSGAVNQTLQGNDRIGKASGGAVSKINYAAKATELLNLARKAQKAHGESSKPLLKMPDELIAGALKLAQQGPTNG